MGRQQVNGVLHKGVPGTGTCQKKGGRYEFRRGVGIWVFKSYDLETLKVLFIDKHCKMQAIRLPSQKFILLNVYHPFGDIDTFFTSLEAALENITDTFPEYDIAMVGDFNIDLLHSSRNTNRIMQLSLAMDMVQLVTIPTRIQGSSKTLIEHVHAKTRQPVQTS